MGDKKVQAGIAFLVLAAGVFAYFEYTGKDDSGLTCGLTGAGVGLIVSGVTHGRSVPEIMAGPATGLVLPSVCKPVVESLLEDPNDAVAFDLRLPSGQVIPTTVPGTDLLATPSPTVGDIIMRARCRGWTSAFLFELCVQGQLSPRS